MRPELCWSCVVEPSPLESIVRHWIRLARHQAGTAAILAVIACGGGEGIVTQPTNNNPTIDLSVGNPSVSIAAGASGSIGVSIARGGGFAGEVSVAVEGLPAGITASLAPATIAAGATTSTITFTVVASVTPNVYPLTLRASGAGVASKAAPIVVTVTGSAQNYSISLSAATSSLAQGGSGNLTVNLTRTGGFTGSVAFGAEGLPAGVTASFNPTSTATDASVLTLTASSTATTGTSTITVRATATGQTDKTAAFALTVTAAAGGSFTLAITQTTITVAQGASGTANITLTRTGGFAGAVALTAENLPTGVTPAFNPASVTGTTSVLTLTVAASAPAASATILVRGTSAGQQDKSATFLFTVSAAAGGYTLSLTPTSASLAQGSNATSAVNITRTNGFAGAVILSATGLPNGVTAAFNPNPTTTNSSTLTLTAAATAIVGTATVTIRGTATGLVDQTTTLSLTVTASSGGSGNTSFEFCTASDTPIWLAIQDGANGTWTRITPTGTKFQFNITQAKGGVAFVSGASSGSIARAQQSNFATRMTTAMQRELLARNRPMRVNASVASAAVEAFTLSILYGTQTELNTQGTNRCAPGTGKTVNGSVANVPAGQTATVTLGPRSATVTGGAATTFALTKVPDGSLDLIASRAAVNPTTFQFTLDKLIIRRALNQANGSTMPVLDFNAGEAFAPQQANITVGNLGADQAVVSTVFVTSFGPAAAAASLFGGGLPNTGPFTYYGVPTAKQAGTDLHLVQVTALNNINSPDNIRSAGLYFKDPTDRTVTLGAALTAPTISVAATAPYVRFRATAAIQPAYNKALSIVYSQANSTLSRTVQISATEGYLSGLGTYDFTIPDFTTAAGWDNNWGLKVGISTQAIDTGVGYTGIGVGQPNPVEGATFTTASRFSTITP